MTDKISEDNLEASKFQLGTEKLPIEEVAKYPLPGMTIPGNIAFSPDDHLICYLLSEDMSLTRQLFATDTTSAEKFLLISPVGGGTRDDNVSLAEALRRERMRQREFGVTAYSWAKNSNRLLVPMQGEIYVQDGQGAPLRKIVAQEDAPAVDAKISPDGEWVAYVQDAELYVVPAAGGEARQLTSSARGTGKTHGLAEYIAQEEMARRSGFWWSPDGKKLAFEEVDETHIPVYRIVHQGKENTGEGAQEDHHYPFAGQANARVRLGVIPVQGGDPVWMDLGEELDIYLARVQWLPDGSLTAQIENRAQTRLDLLKFDLDSGKSSLLLREENDIWINLHDLFRPLKSGGFIWASERSGYRHLYLYEANGELVGALTRGEWMVDAIAAVDEENQRLYFTASRENPTESHLYAVSFAGEAPQRLTTEPGTHSVVCDHQCRRFVDTYQALDQPPVVRPAFFAGWRCHEHDLRADRSAPGAAQSATTRDRPGEKSGGRHPVWRNLPPGRRIRRGAFPNRCVCLRRSPRPDGNEQLDDDGCYASTVFTQPGLSHFRAR